MMKRARSILFCFVMVWVISALVSSNAYGLTASTLNMLFQNLKQYQRFHIQQHTMQARWEREQQKVSFTDTVSGEVTKPGKSLYFALFNGFTLKSVEGKLVKGTKIKTPFSGLPGYLVWVRLKRPVKIGEHLSLKFQYETNTSKTYLYFLSKKEALFQSFFYPMVDDQPVDVEIAVHLPPHTTAVFDGEGERKSRHNTVSLRTKNRSFFAMGMGEWVKRRFKLKGHTFIFYGTRQTAQAFPAFAGHLAKVFDAHTAFMGVAPPCNRLRIVLPETLPVRPYMMQAYMAVSSTYWTRYQKGENYAFPLRELFYHEIGHCYFGMGVRNFLQFTGGMWLIEGMAQYLQLSLQTKHYAKTLSFPQIAAYEISKMQDPRFAAKVLEEAMYLGDERVMYYKGALVLHFLFSYLNDAERQRVLQRAFRESQGKFLNGKIFQKIMEEVTGKDFSALFDAFVFGGTLLDLTIRHVDKKNHLFTIDGVNGLPLRVPVRFRLQDHSTKEIIVAEHFANIPFPARTACIQIDPEYTLLDSQVANNSYCF